MYLAHTVSDATAASVKALKLPGIGFTTESARSYPADAVGGSVVGNVGSDGNGLDGIEYQYNSMLQGRPGVLAVDEDPRGHDIPDTAKTKVAAQRGTDVVLTLDEDLQWQAEYSLLDQVKATGAKSGMAVVIDVTNGDVLAMATIDGATATTPARIATPNDHNAPLTDLFEPGSTNKLITLSWALEHGAYHADDDVQVPYSIKVDAQVAPYYDAEPHSAYRNGIEHWTTADILQRVVERRHDRDRAKHEEPGGRRRRARVRAREPDVGRLAGPTGGLLIPPSQYYSTGKYSTAIGYGVAVTGHADARRVHDDRERRRVAPAASARRDDRREGRAPPCRPPRERVSCPRTPRR